MGEEDAGIRPDHKVAFSTNERFGKQRLALALAVAALLERSGIQNWSLDSGTLLGAWRDGRLVPHDDDIDLLIYLPRYQRAQLDRLHQKLAPGLVEPYGCRVVDTYCQKLEFFDPTHGSYTLHGAVYRGADYHHVTCDLQVYSDVDDPADTARMLHDNGDHLLIDRRLMTFDNTIELEGRMFRCVTDPKPFLSCLYGYLGRDSVYNPRTRLYDKIPSGVV